MLKECDGPCERLAVYRVEADKYPAPLYLCEEHLAWVYAGRPTPGHWPEGVPLNDQRD